MLTNKVIVVVGGTTGIGRSAANAIVQANGRVVVIGRDAENCAATERELGTACRALSGDACHSDTTSQAIQLALASFGGFHGLYHVAGGSGRRLGDGPLDQLTDDGWELTLQWNLGSVFHSNRAAVRQFLSQGTGGAILNTGSVLASSPSPRFFATHAYAAAKAAIVGLTRSSAAYYAASNIRCNVLSPALVETPMSRRAATNPEIMSFIARKQPLDGGRIGQPADLDQAAVFLLSDAARFITGQELIVDGGWSVSEGA